MKYVACYCRVSTEEQKKFGFSIQAQKDALEKYCKENNYKYEFYIDEGISASSMKKRKALQEMLSKSNVFDMIYTETKDPIGTWEKASAVALPAFAAVNEVFQGKVLPD